MKKHNFPAAFFINTLPISDGIATITHKMHIVGKNCPQNNFG